MTDEPKTSRPPPFLICHSPSAICHLPSAVRHLPFAICHSPSAIRHLPSVMLAPLSALLLFADPRDVRLGIELLARALVAHEPHGAEDRPLGPWAVVLAAYRPGNSGVAVGVAAVHLIAIVQIDCDPKCRLGVDRPLQDLLGPVHPKIIMHTAGNDHLHLCRVP